MALLYKSCALFLLISICQAKKPTITPSESTITKNVGDELVIKCTSNEEMAFHIKLDYPKSRSKSTQEKFGLVGGKQTHYYKKKSLSTDDIGWYGCANSNVKVDINKRNQSNVSWIFVNVKNTTPHILVPHKTIPKNEGEKLHIKCSSPKEAKFYFVPKNSALPSSQLKREDYIDSNRGEFMQIIEKDSLIPGDSGWYGCAFKGIKIDTHKHNQSDVSWVYVNIHSKAPVLEPLTRPLEIHEGQEFVLKCTGHRDMKFYTVLHDPNKSSPSIEKTHSITGGERQHSFKKKSLVTTDSGWYGCAFDNVKVDYSKVSKQDDVNWVYLIVRAKDEKLKGRH